MTISFISVTKFLVLLLNVGVIYAASLSSSSSSSAEAQGIETKRTLSDDDQSSELENGSEKNCKSSVTSDEVYSQLDKYLFQKIVTLRLKNVMIPFI
jgi:hypothetical protein